MNYIEYVADKSAKASTDQRWERIMKLVVEYELEWVLATFMQASLGIQASQRSEENFKKANELLETEKLVLIELLEDLYLGARQDEEEPLH